MIEIVKHKKSKSYNTPDVSINLSEVRGVKQFGLITMRNDVWKRFSTGYVKFAYDEQSKRLYMTDGNKKEGYRLYARSINPEQSKNRYMRISQKSFVDMVRDLIGDYDMEYDTGTGWFYIEI